MAHMRRGGLRRRCYYGFVAATMLVLLVFVLKTSQPVRDLDRAPQFQKISIGKDNVTNVLDWSRFAYVQYATNLQYLCNSVILFESLHRLGSKPDRLLLYPSSFSTENNGKVSVTLQPQALIDHTPMQRGSLERHCLTRYLHRWLFYFGRSVMSTKQFSDQSRFSRLIQQKMIVSQTRQASIRIRDIGSADPSVRYVGRVLHQTARLQSDTIRTGLASG